MKLKLLTLLITISFSLSAQNNFEIIRQQYLQEINHLDPISNSGPKENEHDKYKRWEYFTSRRLDQNGNIPSMETILNTWEHKKQLKINSTFKSNTTGNWTSLNPSTIPIGGPKGTGRVHKIYIEPWNTNNIWVCSSTGGLWKSTDAGFNWQALTDNLPTLGTSDIAVDPNNPLLVYLASGENSFSPSSISKGIFKSTDGGISWNYLSLDPNSTNLFAGNIFRLGLHPVNSNILLAAGSNGLNLSNDAGLTWTTKINNRFYDIEFHPDRPDTIYSCDDNIIYRSTDAGINWTALNTGIPASSRRIELAVTTDEPDYIYALVQNSSFGYGGLYRSTDAGNSWTLQSTTPNVLGATTNPAAVSGGRNYCELTVDPTNKDIIYTAGNYFVCKSTDGGLTFTVTSNWTGPYTTTGNGVSSNYVHVDMHDIHHHPTQSNVVFVGCDGGVFKTTNGGSTWNIIGDNMHIAQIYRINNFASNADIVGYGTQDNAHYIRNGNSCRQVGSLDGMEIAFHPLNQNIFYYLAQNGRYFFRVVNGFTTDISVPEFGNWVAPFLLDNEHPDTLYLGLKDIYISYNRGTSWTNVSNGTISNSDKSALAQAPSNPNTFYLASDTTIYKSTDRGLTWVSLGRPNGTGSSPSISYIAVDHNNSEHLWISCSNYINNIKVFESVDGGQSWTNISLNLPNAPVNTIVHENNPNNGIYVGTDIGVYYYNSNIGTWIDFNQNLPNVIVSELEIAPSIGKIRAGTYGRGLWESDLYINTTVGLASDKQTEQVIVFPNPVQDNINISLPDSWSSEIVLMELYSIDGKKILSEYYRDKIFSKDLSQFPKGFYVLSLTSTSKNFFTKIVIE